MTDIQVYKIGEVHFKVYGLGNANGGSWAELTTEIVETCRAYFARQLAV